MISAVWGGADYAVTQPWGCTPLVVEPYWQQAQCHWHCGIDIGCPMYTPLFAARGGRVSQLSYGILGIAVQGTTETDYYVHVDRATVAYGATVSAGQLVAYSGDKIPAGGSLTGPHLHFEVNTGNVNVPASSLDPVPVLEQTYSGGGSTLAPDMTPEEHAWLEAVYHVLSPVNLTQVLDAVNAVSANVDTANAGIAALKASGGSTGPSAPLKLGGSFTGTLSAE